MKLQFQTPELLKPPWLPPVDVTPAVRVMLFPKILPLLLLLSLPPQSFLRPSGFAQIFNNWPILQNRRKQFAFESAQANRPDIPIYGHGNDFAVALPRQKKRIVDLNQGGNTEFTHLSVTYDICTAALNIKYRIYITIDCI